MKGKKGEKKVPNCGALVFFIFLFFTQVNYMEPIAAAIG